MPPSKDHERQRAIGVVHKRASARPGAEANFRGGNGQVEPRLATCKRS